MTALRCLGELVFRAGGQWNDAYAAIRTHRSICLSGLVPVIRRTLQEWPMLQKV